jgi:hypothetical protein
MTEELWSSLVAVLCVASTGILAVFLLQGLLKKTRAARKRRQAEITAHKILQGQYTARRVGEWIRVAEYDFCIHRVVEQTRPERLVLAEVEYRNESGEESLSCRRNQWTLFAADGYHFDVSSLPRHYRERHPFEGVCFINPGRNARGWLAFPVPEGKRLVVLQFRSAFIGVKTADIDLAGAVETDAPTPESAGPCPPPETSLPLQERAAGDFLRRLPGADLKADLKMAAEMAGLKMLRSSGADLGRHTPGHMLLGAIPDQAYEQMQRFLLAWSLGNGLPAAGFGEVQIPDQDKAYLPGVARLEPDFDAICQGHGLKPADHPYAAALAALKLAADGKQSQRLDGRAGQYMIYFHLLTASKTVPERLSYADLC